MSKTTNTLSPMDPRSLGAQLVNAVPYAEGFVLRRFVSQNGTRSFALYRADELLMVSRREYMCVRVHALMTLDDLTCHEANLQAIAEERAR